MERDKHIKKDELDSSEESVISVNNDNVWDDTELIRAYDKAMTKANTILENIADGEKKTAKHTSAKEPNNIQRWKLGMRCRTTYSVDDLEYEAKIIDIFSPNCLVRYIGYGNEEIVPLANLKPSHGDKVIRKQISASKEKTSPNEMFYNNNTDIPLDMSSNMIPPPPPMNVISHFPKDESEALSAMLMSWYMSGYHTGYYLGLKAQSKGTSRFSRK